MQLLVEGETREHLIKIGNQVHSALPEMLATDLDTAAVSMKAARAFVTSLKNGVSLSKDTADWHPSCRKLCGWTRLYEESLVDREVCIAVHKARGSGGWKPRGCAA